MGDVHEVHDFEPKDPLINDLVADERIVVVEGSRSVGILSDILLGILNTVVFIWVFERVVFEHKTNCNCDRQWNQRDDGKDEHHEDRLALLLRRCDLVSRKSLDHDATHIQL